MHSLRLALLLSLALWAGIIATVDVATGSRLVGTLRTGLASASSLGRVDIAPRLGCGLLDPSSAWNVAPAEWATPSSSGM